MRNDSMSLSQSNTSQPPVARLKLTEATRTRTRTLLTVNLPDSRIPAHDLLFSPNR